MIPRNQLFRNQNKYFALQILSQSRHNFVLIYFFVFSKRCLLSRGKIAQGEKGLRWKLEVLFIIKDTLYLFIIYQKIKLVFLPKFFQIWLEYLINSFKRYIPVSPEIFKKCFSKIQKKMNKRADSNKSVQSWVKIK